MGTPHSSPHNETPPSLLHPSGLHSLLQAGDILRPCVLQTPVRIHKQQDSLLHGQTVDCYDYNNQGGDRLHLTDYTPSLRKYNFDNRIESCCFTGIWLLYDLDNYGAGSGNSMDWWAYGNNYCTNVPGAFINRASSVRFTGAPDDWNYDTINMYFNEYFIGDEEFTYNDTPLLNYDNRAQSIVVTGCHPWTIYEYDSYRGYAMCLYPESTSKCTPGFYSTRQSLGRLAGQVSSVRKGCYAKDKVLPDNHGLPVRSGNMGGMGAMGGSGFNTGNEE